jgi:peptidoglycan/LPS O-acetylase OafA/YrhL
MLFRHDINGLRSIAVLAVVFFHFNPQWLTGGFAGVDVFFVISGYLMTGIIFKGLEKQNLSLLSFYISRAKRIIPALAVLGLFLMIFGWFFLSPLEYKALGKHVTASITFISNLIYWQESGYFAASSHTKWLLHTWSLSVEWQFYIIYPLLLLIASKFVSIKRLRHTILFSAIVGFLYCINASYIDSNSSFYLLSTRAWEMLVGGIAFLYPLTIKKNYKIALELSGMSLIIFSYFTFSELDLWPGYLALVPVLGAFLIITANHNQSIITGNVVFQQIGSASYSIYLWHWPIVVGLAYFNLTGPYIIIMGMIASLLIGFSSYYFIEKKLVFTLSNFNFQSILFYKPLVLAVMVSLLGSFIFISKGVINRYTPEQQIEILKQYKAIGDWDYPVANKVVENMHIRYIEGNNKNFNTLFIGDSLIEQYYPKALALSKAGLGNIWFLTDSGCMPIPNTFRKNLVCNNSNQLDKLLQRTKFQNIVVGGDWSIYLGAESPYYIKENDVSYSLNTPFGRKLIDEKIDLLFKQLGTKTKSVFFILPTPMGDMFDPKVLMRNVINNDNIFKQGYDKNIFKSRTPEFYSYMKELSIRYNFTLIDPIDTLCPTNNCYVADDEHVPFYKDGTHLRPLYVVQKASFLDVLLGI